MDPRPAFADALLEEELQGATAASVVNLEVPGVDPAAAWRIFADTEAVNRLLGSPEIEVEHLPVRSGVSRRRFTTRDPSPLAYEEEHYQWEEGRWVGGRRFFLGGPLEKFLFLFTQHPTADGARCELRIGMWGRGEQGAQLAATMVAALSDGFRSFQEQLRRAHLMSRPGLIIPARHEERLDRTQLRVLADALLDSGEAPPVVGALVDHLETATDHEVAHMAPLALAADWQLDSSQVIDAFIRGARLGLLIHHWSVACPSCRGPKGVTTDIVELAAAPVHCEDCNISFAADPSENIALSFAPAPSVRRIEETFVCVGAPSRTPHVKVQVYVPPCRTVQLRRAVAGAQALWLASPDVGASLELEHGGDYRIGGGQLTPSGAAGENAAAPLSFTNDHPERVRVRVEDRATPATFLLASMVLERPRFRELFGADQWDFLSAMQRAWKVGFGASSPRVIQLPDAQARGPYDLLVVGAGPGGEAAALRAAHLGRKVAVIEASPVFGGPSGLASKAMREAVHQIVAWSNVASRTRTGPPVDAGRRETVVRTLFERRFALLRRYVASIEMQDVLQRLSRAGVSLHHGFASFGDDGTLQVRPEEGDAGYALQGRYVLLATGSSPARPAHIPFDDERVLDATSMGALEHLPRTLCIAGAGVIGCEFATILAALGVKVTLLGGGRRPLPFLDQELATAGLAQMERAGIRILTQARLAGVEVQGERVHVALTDGPTLPFDALLYAEGREANSAGLGLERVGVQAGRYGRLAAGDDHRTSNPTIFAIGDLLGKPGLASTAAEQGRSVAERLFGDADRATPGAIFPTTIWTFPELAGVGMTQEQAASPVVGRACYRDLPRGILSGELHGWLKLVADRDTGRLLGVHIIGEQACELIHYGAALVAANASLQDLARAGFSALTFHDLYQVAAEDALRVLAAEARTQGAPAHAH